MRKQKQTPGNDERLRHSARFISIFAIRFFLRHFLLILFQISSSSARSASPSRLPCACSSSSGRLNRATNLSVAGLQYVFGIEFAFAREIDRCEQQIANLVLDHLFAFRTDPSCAD
jgi:hypothetical protein